MSATVRHRARSDNYEEVVRESFARQAMMASLGARLTWLEPGEAHVEFALSTAYTQQNGHMHAGALAAIADSACGYAAFSLAEAESDVLTVEFKINLLAPANAARFEARAKVLRSGKTLTVCAADVVGFDRDEVTLVATMIATLIIRPKPR